MNLNSTLGECILSSDSWCSFPLVMIWKKTTALLRSRYRHKWFSQQDIPQFSQNNHPLTGGQLWKRRNNDRKFFRVQPRHGKECFKSTCDTHNSWLFAVCCKNTSLTTTVIPVASLLQINSMLSGCWQTKEVFRGKINLQTFQTHRI